MNKLNFAGRLLLLLSIAFQNLSAQNELQTVLVQDSLFWHHFNNCQIDDMGTFVTEDLEFYHVSCHHRGEIFAATTIFIYAASRWPAVSKFSP